MTNLIANTFTTAMFVLETMLLGDMDLEFRTAAQIEQ